jgi:DNA-binding MarR family transcriptional regulator
MSNRLAIGAMTFPTHPALEGYTGFLLRKISTESFERFASATAEHGLHPMHFGMLNVLDADGPISQQALCDCTGIDPSSMVARMDVLEEAGMVERRRREEDRRAYEISLTEKGRTTLEELRAVTARQAERLLAPLDTDERETLNDLLRRVSANLGD